MNPIALHRRRRFAVASALLAVDCRRRGGRRRHAAGRGLRRSRRRHRLHDVARNGPTFDMTTDADYINLPDGNTAYMYGYKLVGPSSSTQARCCASTRATPSRSLSPTPCPATCRWCSPARTTCRPTAHRPAAVLEPGRPGDDDVADQSAATNGGTVTYSFVADHPGTFLYESGTDPDVQVRMGLFGALIVRPSGGADYA